MEKHKMNIWKTLLPATAALLIATQAAAQTDADRIEVEREQVFVEQEVVTQEFVTQEVAERNAEVERRMYDAERRMAEAARQIVILTDERLPQLQGMQQRIQIFGSDRPRLGVTIGGAEDGPVKGVEILGVTPGSAAQKAGLRAGDLITSVNGESLGAPSTDEATTRLLDFMQGVELGDTLDLGYVRDGKTGEVQVEPALNEGQVLAFSSGGFGMAVPSAPNVQVIPGMPSAPHQMVFHWASGGWGDMELVELSAGLGQYFGTDHGLLVVSAPESTSLQLEDGDVIQKIDGREPTSVRHALRILGSYQAGESLKLEIMRDKKRRTLDVEIPDDLSSGLVPEAAPVVQPARVPVPSRLAVPSAPVERT
jgi:S1-C subfamily serine protease